jgi:hypothetical protein
MAAAAAADLLQIDPSITPGKIESALKGTGKLITDSRNGRLTPRIDVLAAADAVASGNIPPPPDTTPPAAKAKAATIKRRKTAKLRFVLTDRSGQATVVASVFRRKTRLKKWGPETLDSGSHFYRWRAPAKPQRLLFCVRAKDAAGNQSKQSCASLTVT